MARLSSHLAPLVPSFSTAPRRQGRMPCNLTSELISHPHCPTHIFVAQISGARSASNSFPSPLRRGGLPNDAPPPRLPTRPWKDVYCERLTIERTWRCGRCAVRTLKSYTDGVMCLQLSESLSHPSFLVLITGSYDHTAQVWNLETRTEVQCLSGHTRAIRALQFDEAKLITGSMDHTMRVWNRRTVSV